MNYVYIRQKYLPILKDWAKISSFEAEADLDLHTINLYKGLIK